MHEKSVHFYGKNNEAIQKYKSIGKEKSANSIEMGMEIISKTNNFALVKYLNAVFLEARKIHLYFENRRQAAKEIGS